MTKQDFLETLRGTLSGRVTSGMVAENIHYYEDYINTEVRKGKSEGEVLASLGDPRLIARTIIETKGGKETEYGEYDRAQGNRRQSGRLRPNIISRVPALIWLILVILIVILILSAIFSVITAVLPVVLPILLVLLLVKIFRDWVH